MAKIYSAKEDGNSDDKDDNDDWNVPTLGEQDVGGFADRSRMPGYIRSFLDKERVKRGDSPRPAVYTHMIGVPMFECHDLMIQLESVQRAVIYHCPALIHACIVPTNSRMPLLYIDASGIPISQVTTDLFKMIKTVVKKHCFTKEAKATSEAGEGEEEVEVDDSFAFDGLNKDGHRPLTLTFHQLEIDGKENEVLYTVVKPDTNGQLQKLQTMVDELRSMIHEQGWKTILPPNDSQSIVATSRDESLGFIPRIPFMRLPSNFDDYLEDLPEDAIWRTPQEGGNGISPILWGKWMDDVFGTNVRLREIGIYPRQPGTPNDQPLDENAYYMPHEVVALPVGNEKLSMEEAKHQKYNDERYEEAEKRIENADESDEEKDFFDPNLEENRKILESMYESSGSTWEEQTELSEKAKVDAETSSPGTADQAASTPDRKLDDVDDDVETIVNEMEDDEDLEYGLVTRNAADGSPSGHLDDWMKDRIRKIVENRESVKARQPASESAKKDLPPIEDNPVFKAYRSGALDSKEKETEAAEEEEDAPGTRRRQDMVGFWKVLRSPTGLPLSNDPSSSATDNFVLRVDGLVAGGPVLEPETQQRAAGGSWKLIKDEENDQVRIQIRLVIPPSRQRILVMDGTVSDSLLPSSSSLSSPSELSRFVQQSLNEDGNEGVVQSTTTKSNAIYCSGKVCFSYYI